MADQLAFARQSRLVAVLRARDFHVFKFVAGAFGFTDQNFGQPKRALNQPAMMGVEVSFEGIPCQLSRYARRTSTKCVAHKSPNWAEHGARFQAAAEAAIVAGIWFF